MRRSVSVLTKRATHYVKAIMNNVFCGSGRAPSRNIDGLDFKDSALYLLHEESQMLMALWA